MGSKPMQWPKIKIKSSDKREKHHSIIGPGLVHSFALEKSIFESFFSYGFIFPVGTTLSMRTARVSRPINNGGLEQEYRRVC